MRKLLLTLALVSAPVMAADYVQGYIRQDGTYVQPHYRTSPDGTRFNNYSTQGNVNPYTGAAGTVNPYQYNSPYPSTTTQPAPRDYRIRWR